MTSLAPDTAFVALIAQKHADVARRAALAQAGSLPDFVSSTAAVPRNPTAQEIASYPVIRGSRIATSGAQPTPILWNGAAWVDNGLPLADAPTVTAIGGGLNLLQNTGPTLAASVNLTPVGQFALLDLAGLQATLNAKAAAGGGIVSLDSRGNYTLSTSLTIPTGVYLKGQYAPIDSSKKGSTSASTELGTVIRMRGNAQFIMEASSKIGHLVELYDQQNYNIVADAGQPDGLSAFVNYPVTHLIHGDYNGAEVDNVLYLGGSKFAETVSGKNPEKLRITNVAGMFTDTFLKIFFLGDTPMVSNVFMNANSLYALVNAVGGSVINFHTKLAKNAVLLKIGRMDEGHFYRLFAFGIKTFAEFRNYGDLNDDGGGGGASFVNCAGDGVAYAFDIGRFTMNYFGIKVVNSWFTALVKKWIENGVAVDAGRTPALAIFQNGAHDVTLQLVNTLVYGNSSPVITDSGARYVDFVAGSGTGGSVVQLLNYSSAAGSLLHDGNFEISDVNLTKPRLQGANVLFHGVSLDLSPVPDMARGAVLGAAPADGSVVGLYTASRRGRFVQGTGQGKALTGPTAGGTVTFSIAGRTIGYLYYAAGATSSDPANTTSFDTHINAGDVIQAVVSGMAGSSGLSWSVPIYPVV